MDGGEQPPPKRRRTEGPSHDTIAQINAHLQYLQGNRQNRWLSGRALDMESQLEPASAVTSAATASANRVTNKNKTDNASAHSAHAHAHARAAPLSNIITLDLEEESATGANVQRATATPMQQERGPSFLNQTQPQSSPLLVQYETPMMGDIMATPVAVVNGNSRKSLDPTGRVPGLPSPAPSDENTNSPTFSENQLAAMRVRPQASRRNSADMNMASFTLPASSGSPIVMQSPAFGQMPDRQNSIPGQQQQIPRQSQYQPVVNPLAQQHQPQQQPARGHQRRSTPGNIQVIPYAAPILPPNGNPLRTPTTLPSNHGHPQQRPTRPPEAMPLPASRIPTDQLLARLDQQENQLRPMFSATDNGRLTLLRDAVHKGDWFYQLLSQLFCIRSTSPDQLPNSIRTLHPSSFEHLGFLLCPNSEVNNDLLKFFCRFPEPIMDIYSDNYREVYEARVQKIRLFLERLPIHWDGLVNRCKEMMAPPLVQDMVEVLHLGSAVLQSTCFRAIARMFWGVQDSSGIKALEQVHEIDQSTFYLNGFRRSSQEKPIAYAKLRRIYDTWNKAVALQQAAGSARVQFNIPQDVLDFFQAPTQALLAQLQQMQQQARLVQQQQHLQQHVSSPQALSAQQQALGQSYIQAQGIRPGPQGQSSPTQPQDPFPVPQQQSLAPQFQTAIAAFHTPNQQPMPPHVMPNTQWVMHGASVPSPTMLKAPIFPPYNQCPRSQPTHPDPNRSGIHQSHLQSPILGPIEAKLGAPRLYRYVIGYALGPTQVKKSSSSQVISFSLSEKAFGKLAKTYKPSGPGERATRFLDEDSLTYRLRCATLPLGGFDSESAWVIAENYWPEDLSFELNGKRLEMRRKLHHGRYLPVDLTTYVKAGENRLKVLVTHRKEDKNKVDYAVAVEAVGVTSDVSIHSSLKRISDEQSLTSIKSHLAGNDYSNDDEIAVTSSSMVIKLFDPYSGSRLVDIPVRGVNCLHKDVFDLEIFLAMCRREQPGWPTVVDCWRCPLCRGDVRPHTLVVDEFLVEVLDELKKRRLTDVKAIVAEADGGWKPKEEERTGVRSPSLEREGGRRSASASMSMAPQGQGQVQKVVEIIELD